MIHLPPFPPFGFSVWYDRHHGRRWCWRERRPSGSDDDVTEGDGFEHKTDAVLAVRRELARRKARTEANSPPDA